MKNKMPLQQARNVAERIVERLKKHCTRIEIAGSVRRCKPEVGDIEIVAEPLPTYDLFNVATYDPHELDGVAWTDWGRLVKDGHKYKQIELLDGINLDLFIVTPPAQWGVIFTIRTGSAEFSHRLVTTRQHGGLMPSNYRIQDGAVWSNNHIIETPEEADVFNLFGVEYIKPELRTA